ncbi:MULTISPECIES: hypothetical protein [unclassified Sphingobium]|uniref:hypothetical protein n=1 Tax=unclassified Sphingobium TaxID=2611147 RepID=UPI0035A58FD0
MATAPHDTTEIEPVGTHPAHAEAEGTLRRLKESRDAIERELFDLEAEITAALIAERESEDAAALRLIDGDDAPDIGVEDMQARATKLRNRLGAFKRAIAMQRARLREIRADASSAAAFALLPRHRLAVAGIVAAMEGLRRAIDAEREVRAQLSDAGYDQRLQDFTPPMVLSDADLGQAAWLARAKGYAG